MKALHISFLLLFLCAALCKGQNIKGTFQGEIVNVSPFFLHIEEDAGVITGFCKYPSDSIVVPLTGKMDKKGSIILTGTKKAFPVFTGKLQNRLVQGTFVRSKNADTHPFYALDLRGEYYDGSGNYRTYFVR